MSVKIMALVWDHYWRGGGHRLTALALADHADHAGENVRPGVKLLMDKTMQSERTVRSQLADFRAEGLLIPVRYAQGGRKKVGAGGDQRGYATEYRFSPLWISNPAEFAPFARSVETVQSDVEKGATDGAKGCKAFAPQPPPRTVIEPTTTEEERGRARSEVVVGHDLEFPAALAHEVRPSAERLLARCPINLRQAVLDEIAGLADRGAVRHPLGLLRRLVELAGNGAFVPAAGIDHRKKLARDQAERERRASEEQERRHRDTPAAREASRRARDAALARLGLRPAPSSSVVADQAASGGDR
jgi:hypothetical protein